MSFPEGVGDVGDAEEVSFRILFVDTPLLLLLLDVWW